MGKDIRSSTSPIALGAPFPLPSLGDAMEEVSLSVDRFCLLAGIEALAEMMEEDATAVCGARHRRHADPKEKSVVSEEAEHWPLNAAREASQDRREGCPTWPLCCFPIELPWIWRLSGECRINRP